MAKKRKFSPEEQQVLVEFGERIRRLRKQRGLNQRQFGAVVAMNRTFISHIERGSRNAAVLTAFRVARGLDLELADLMRGIHLR